MKIPLYCAAAVATLYAATRAVWHGGDGELGILTALLIAAVCTSGAAIVEAIERKPKPVSKDNGGVRKEE